MPIKGIQLGISDYKVPANSHVLYLYDGLEKSSVDAAVNFTLAGFAEGDTVILALPQAYLSKVTDLLPDAEEALESGRLALLSTEQIYLEQDRFSFKKITSAWKRLATLGNALKSIRAFGIPDSCLSSDRLSALKLIEYESCLNAYMPVKLTVCAYDYNLVPNDLLEDLKCTHPYVVDNDGIRVNRSFLPHEKFLQRFYVHSPYEFSWVAKPENCRPARAVVGEMTARMPFDLQEIDDILLSVGEALSNAIRHGSPKGGQNKIHIRIIPDNRSIIIEIIDEGHGICSEPDEINWREPGGKGFFIMRALCDEVEHFNSEKGCTLRLVKKIMHPTDELWK